ncbi:putative tryptophanyl-tRNA synthetase [Rhizodiscina lignyota]|uniref:Tryptophan--tRNA ligase, mitochondrial n=1 Tax=Rhizodiscina lignyota TaxID=1504668 RepID=A0A9P4M1V3_9PEZI|nr:putative tryptophanyl-tRNA synthetase [Rhizodiscina lignyota]
MLRSLAHRSWTSLQVPFKAGQRAAASTLSQAEKKVVFSGIQPTGIPHLGNYLGAFKQWVDLQEQASQGTTLLYSVVDLHAITIRQDPHQLRLWKKEMLASLLAVGLDPERSIIFYQSAVPAHSELMWILSCNASVGYLSRMTQWKSKLSLPENVSPLDPTTKTPLKLGLFSYPVLQAADILVHRATHVPVGSDQAQHLEFARECATSFNHHFGQVLVSPETIISPAKRVMSLTKPEQKMSKSDDNPKSRILITDTEEDISKKIKSALTDSTEGVSYDPVARPGVSNLLDILFHMTGSTFGSREDLVADCQNLSMRAFKSRVAEAIETEIGPVRERFHETLQRENGKYLSSVAELGAKKASTSATGTMNLVRDVVGL